MAPILIFGYGNPARGDDALGPELIQRLERYQAARAVSEPAVEMAPGVGPGLTRARRARRARCAPAVDPERPGSAPWELLTDYQLQLEHALDLVGRARVILVDADASLTVPYRLEPVSPDRDASYCTHALSPGALLWVYTQIGGGPPPPCCLLRIRGYHFALGAPLSTRARANLARAEALVLDYLGVEG